MLACALSTSQQRQRRKLRILQRCHESHNLRESRRIALCYAARVLNPTSCPLSNYLITTRDQIMRVNPAKVVSPEQPLSFASVAVITEFGRQRFVLSHAQSVRRRYGGTKQRISVNGCVAREGRAVATACCHGPTTIVLRSWSCDHEYGGTSRFGTILHVERLAQQQQPLTAISASIVRTFSRSSVASAWAKSNAT